MDSFSSILRLITPAPSNTFGPVAGSPSSAA
jgi:hypothetical protein